MDLKCHKVNLQKQYKAKRTHTKEFDQMFSEEIANIVKDPIYIYRNYWKIIDQITGRMIPFVPWDGEQEELIYNINIYPYWVIVKSRRNGVTEILCRESLKRALLYNHQYIPYISKNQRDSIKTIRIVRDQHNWLTGEADFLRSPLLSDNAQMLQFGYTEPDDFGNKIVKGSNSIIQAFPKGEDAVSGVTATTVPWDEAALQPNTHELFAYALPIIEGTGAEFIISSTARGVGNKHSQLYRQSVDYWERQLEDKKTKFKSMFIGFFARPGRTQADWNSHLREIGNINLCKQEYPRTAEEAFQASSGCVFDIPTLMYMLNNAPLKPMVGSGKFVAERERHPDGIEGKCNTATITFIPVDYGYEVKIYKEYNPQHNYIAGIDVAMNVPGGDYTVCQIFDLFTGEQVAVYRFRKNPELCANDCEILCKWYGEPLAIIEKDGPGLAFLQRFRQIYDNIHGRETIDGIVDKVDYQKLGTSTRGTTKEAYIGLVMTFIYNSVKRDPENPEIITGRSNWGWIYDPVTLEEGLNFVGEETDSGHVKMHADKDAKMDSEDEGSEKMHDDTVIGVMQVCIGIKNEGRQIRKEKSKSKIITILDQFWGEHPDNEYGIIPNLQAPKGNLRAILKKRGLLRNAVL